MISNIKEGLLIQRNNLTAAGYDYSINTIEALRILKKNRKEISQLLDEAERNQRITDLTGLIAEPGLTSGSTPEEIENSIINLVERVKNAYNFDQERRDTKTFFQEAFMGAPCFNGRIIALERYIAEKQNLQSYKEQFPYDRLACQVEEYMHEYIDLRKLPSDQPPPYEAFKEFVFQKYGSIENFKRIYERASEFIY